jgi:hypothetical protein
MAIIRIGILLTRSKAEKKKDELVNINSKKRPWLKNSDKNYNSLTIKRGNKICVPGDVSIGLYILWNWKNIEIDFIHPHEISLKRLHSNDINFMLIYDLLESFHVDKRKIFEKFKNTLKKCNNVYPPYYYQKFINNKCSYINHLDKNKSPVIPTFCIMKDTYNKKGMSKTIKLLRNEVEKNEWDIFIGKPVYGQESIDFKKFNSFNEASLRKYLGNGFKKYPGLIFQKYIDGFDKSNPEIRLYYIGDKYKYSVITNDKTVKIPKSEQGTEKVNNKEKLIKTGKKAIDNLPNIKMKGKILPRLLTRIDVGCEKNFRKPWIINEVEFVPSLYIENVNFIPEIDMGDQIVKIAKKFKSSK